MFSKTQTAAQFATLITPTQRVAMKSTPWKVSTLPHIQFKPVYAPVAVLITSNEEPTYGRYQQRLHLKQCHIQFYTQSCHVVTSVKCTHPQFPHYSPLYWILLHNSWRHDNLYKFMCQHCNGSYIFHNVTHVTNTYFCANRGTGDLKNRAELCRLNCPWHTARELRRLHQRLCPLSHCTCELRVSAARCAYITVRLGLQHMGDCWRWDHVYLSEF